MGLRLKTQLTALFLFLFGFSFLWLAYFNVQMLGTAVHSRAIEQARSSAVQVSDWATREIPRSSGKESLNDVVVSEPTVLVHYLERVPNLYCLELLSAPPGQTDRVTRIFRYGLQQQQLEGHDERVKQALQGDELWCLWEFSSDSDVTGRRVLEINPFAGGRVQFEYYAPVFTLPEEQGSHPRIEGVVHVSLLMPNGPLRLRVAIIGNAVLGLVFIFTGFLSINLWAQHALTRPLDGLMRARERLERAGDNSDVEDLFSSNELVAVSNSLNRLSLDLSKYQGELEEKTRRLEQANERYRQLNERLEQQVEEKTRELREFFSLVTHDLRIPLAATQGYADLMLKKDLNDKQRRYVRSIRTANSHALELVRNLLDAMRYESGQNQTVVPERFVFAELVQDVISHLSVPGDEGQTTPIQTDIPADVTVVADRTRIERVLGNLVSNALRHIQEGQTVLVVARPAGPNLRIEVQDNGPGIPAEHLPLLFEKFTHFPSSEGPSSGLGLGLYIVRRILESHGESIHVESQVGQGTRFWFHLPIGEQHGA